MAASNQQLTHIHQCCCSSFTSALVMLFLSIIILIIDQSLAAVAANQYPHPQNNNNSNGSLDHVPATPPTTTTTTTTSLNKIVLKKLSLLDENTFIEEALFPENNFRCGHDPIILTKHFGFVKNPDYPKGSYKIPIFCRWNIVGSNPEDIITISIDELDIENRNHYSGRRCSDNYLKISELSNEKYFCDKLNNNDPTASSSVYISYTNSISVVFNATTNRHSKFYFSYIITPKFSENCFSNEFRCLNGKCIPRKWACNRKNECGDASDELQCNTPSAEYIKCGGKDPREYYHISKRCDGKIDCSNKADEHGCTYCEQNQFRCLSSPNKCINNTMLCNGIPDCHDLSDELDCLTSVQYCPPQNILCGSMSHCYDQKAQRCNKVLDCPNGADELNCFDHCQGKIMCASGDGCYDLEERCNGIVQCADYSDEKNCTLELCRPDKGSFLCTNGRCIPYVWTCDRSADCYDGSDEMRCLKNSVITAAIIGSLICGLLIVIAVSCGCKLVALRHLEQYRNSINSASHSRQLNNTDFPNPNDLDTSLFRLEHSVLFREPPPSYASAMGGYHDPNGSNSSYAEQYRRYRQRQRRCRRVLRRLQHRNNLQQQQQNNLANGASSSGNNHSESMRDASNQNNESVSSSETTILNVNDHNHPATTNTDTSSSYHHNLQQEMSAEKKSAVESSTLNSQTQLDDGSMDNSNSSHHNPLTNHHHHYPHAQANHNNNSLAANATHNNNNHNTNDNLNIELEPIVPLTNFDCDSQPLIR